MGYFTGIINALKRSPSAVGSIVTDSVDTVNPVGTVRGAANAGGSLWGINTLGTRTVNTFNTLLSGKDKNGNFSLLGTTVRAGLIFGAIYAGSKLIGNFLERLKFKRASQGVQAETEAVKLRTAAANMHAMADEIEMSRAGGGVYQFHNNPLAQDNNVERYASSGPRSPLENAQKGAAAVTGEVSR